MLGHTTQCWTDRPDAPTLPDRPESIVDEPDPAAWVPQQRPPSEPPYDLTAYDLAAPVHSQPQVWAMPRLTSLLAPVAISARPATESHMRQCLPHQLTGLCARFARRVRIHAPARWEEAPEALSAAGAVTVWGRRGGVEDRHRSTGRTKQNADTPPQRHRVTRVVGGSAGGA
jgi:hypothetical protein